MKKSWFILVIITFSLASCSKEESQPSTGKVTIYSTESGNWSLIIDGKEYGRIKKASQMPVCGDPAFQNFTLSAGYHSFDAKSLDGYAWGNPKRVNVQGGGCVQIDLP
jgi:hypothetical protein